MSMKKVGLVGSRGMVGHVLLQRMQAEGDFRRFDPVFFSTAHHAAYAPGPATLGHLVYDAYDFDLLQACDVILSCHSNAYTQRVFFPLRAQGWSGYWLDSAATLRLRDDAIIVLDPLNAEAIQQGLARGIKNYIGGNCTVSCMLMALAGLLKAGQIEWISSMTYQAASGAGSAYVQGLLKQFGQLHAEVSSLLDHPSQVMMALDHLVSKKQYATADTMPWLAGNLIPWIDDDLGQGQSREEWKTGVEANKILPKHMAVKIDGLCVRVGVMRCHAQALTMKLKDTLPLDEIAAILGAAHPWVTVVPNTAEATTALLTPHAVAGSLQVSIGRLRKMQLGDHYLSAFTIGDQLLWGAAEPLRRMLSLLLDFI